MKNQPKNDNLTKQLFLKIMNWPTNFVIVLICGLNDNKPKPLIYINHYSKLIKKKN